MINHVVNFTAPAPGARLIVVVSSYNTVNTPAGGYAQDYSATGYNHVYVFSKIAAGTETSVTLTNGGTSDRVHAVVYERDDCQALQFVKSGTSANSTSISSGAVTVPTLATGRVFGVLNVPGGSAAGATWTMSMTKDYSPTGSNSNSGFASGALPAAGSRTWSVSGLTSTSNNSVLAIVGYGSADATAPTVPGNLRTTAVTGTTIDVAWDASTDAVGVTGYGIYLDNVKQGADQTGLSRAFSGLTVGQSYTIEVDARDAVGNRSARAQIIVSTDATPPTMPGSLHTTAISHTSISVAWNASTDDLTGVAGYGVWLGGVKQGADQVGLSAVLAGLTPGQTYTIEIDARDGAGNRSARAQLVVETTPDTVAPTVPGGLHLVAVAPYGLAVAWEASTDDVAVAGYGVWLGGVKQGADQVGLSRAFTGLAADTSYLVEVDAADAVGNRSAKASLDVATPPDLPPDAPAGLHTVAVTYTSISVAWAPATDDVGVSGYDVVFDEELVATNQAATSAVFPGLGENTEHVVRVLAVDSNGQRGAAAELVVTTLDDTPPTVPTFTAVAGEDSITVAWGPSGDDFAVVGYEVLVDGEVAHSTPGTDYTVDGPVVRRHTVTGLVAGADYDVRVAAVDAVGQRSADNTISVATTALPFLPISSPVYRVGSWAANVRDDFGVDWIVEDAEGWTGTPPVRPTSANLGGTDGVHAGAGLYGARVVRLKGTAVAPSRMAMLAAKQRILGAVHPRRRLLLQVADALMIRQARVRLVDRVEITDETDRGFTWTVVLRAKDPRRYATVATTATAVIDSLPGEASTTLTLSGTYATIPARIRLFGPIRDFTLTHEESGTVMRAMPGTTLPADPGYSLSLDLATRQVWAHVPPQVWPQPRPGRGALAHLPAWFHLLRGVNTLTLAGQPVVGQSGSPRIVVEAFDAWV
ncbi:hypothetical protein GCM10022252_75950 [Streptosporangium oxazolinicum]|uniref:Fibronectin type-III domain-containing protein n=1 Tax=Streptosporangium oxazolinicum TaxID=909287 RepID=A0ABP8BKV4_9ACTN